MATQRVLRGIAVCLALALTQGPADAERPADATKGLKATLAIPKDKIVPGEPLVVYISLANEGNQPAETLYARAAKTPDNYRYGLKFADDTFIIVDYSVFESSKEIATGRVAHHHGFLLGPSTEALPPGASVTTEKVLCPVRDNGWLAAGTYELRVRLAGMGDESHVTEKRPFEVRRPSPEEQEALRVLEPGYASFLEGEGESSGGFVSQRLANTMAKLRHDFPRVVYRQHYEYRMFDRRGIETYRVGAVPYLAEFPDSPYADDILLRLTEFQMHEAQRYSRPVLYDRAAGYIEQLLQRHPDSLRIQEARVLQKHIREQKRQSGMSTEEILEEMRKKAEQNRPKEAAQQESPQSPAQGPGS